MNDLVGNIDLDEVSSGACGGKCRARDVYVYRDLGNTVGIHHPRLLVYVTPTPDGVSIKLCHDGAPHRIRSVRRSVDRLGQVTLKCSTRPARRRGKRGAA